MTLATTENTDTKSTQQPITSDGPLRETYDPLDFVVSDDLLQHLFMQDHLDRFRFNRAQDCWFVYEQGLWAPDMRSAVPDCLTIWLRKYLEAIISEYGPPLNGEGKLTKEHFKLAMRYSSGAGQKAILNMGSTQAIPQLLQSEFDKDKHLLNTPTCVVDLKSGDQLLHDPLRFMTRRTTVGPSRRETPLFDSFLRDITMNDESVAGFLQTFLGYCLTGETSAHKVLFLWGSGGNGKSALLALLREIMGTYAKTADGQILMSGAETRHLTELADLAGARAVVISELPSDAMWSAQRLMSLTGGDTLSARFMRRDLFEYLPQFTLIMASNRRPAVQNPNPAFLRRMLLLRFKFAPAKPDNNLLEKLREEHDGILQWMIDGAVRYYEKGLLIPTSISEATLDYAADEDDIGQWLESRTVKVPKSFVANSTIFPSYQTWADENGGRAYRKRAISERLRQLGFEPGKHQGQRGYFGLKLITEAEQAWQQSPRFPDKCGNNTSEPDVAGAQTRQDHPTVQ